MAALALLMCTYEGGMLWGKRKQRISLKNLFSHSNTPKLQPPSLEFFIESIDPYDVTTFLRQ